MLISWCCSTVTFNTSNARSLLAAWNNGCIQNWTHLLLFLLSKHFSSKWQHISGSSVFPVTHVIHHVNWCVESTEVKTGHLKQALFSFLLSSYQLRQELFQLLSAKRQCKEDEDKWRQETAAFFIQVAWKKQLNHSPLKSAPSCKNLKSINKTSSAIKTSKQSILKQIYGNFVFTIF